MATAEEVLKDAYERYGVKDAETPLTTQEKTDGVGIINDTMSQLLIEGFDLGFTTIAVIGDTFTLDDAGFNNFVKLQIGARIAEGQEIPISPIVAEDIKASRRSVIRFLNRKAVTGNNRGTFRYFVYSAIELLGAKSADEPINEAEQTNSIERLNDIVLNLENFGYGFGFNIGSDLDDATGLPDWSFMYFKGLLAKNLSSSYTVDVPGVVLSMIREGEAGVNARASRPIETQLPDMPLGGRRFTHTNESNDLLDGANDSLADEEGNQILIDLP